MEININTTQVAFFEFNNSEDNFTANAHFTNTFTDLIERFFNISNLFGDRLIKYRSSGNDIPFSFCIKFTSNVEPLVLSGKVLNNEDFQNVLIALKFSIISYLEKFLDGLPTSNALRLSYAYSHSAEISILKYHSHTRKNIFSDCLISFRDFFDSKNKYYEQVLRLDKYEQFVHLKDVDQIDDVRLWNLNENELEQIINFYSDLVLNGKYFEIKEALANIFSGRPTVEYLTLHGRKNQIADTFYQLYVNGKVETKNLSSYKDWVNVRFRVKYGNETGILKSSLNEVFKGKNVVSKNKRLLLPEFLKYYIRRKKSTPKTD